MTVRRALGYSLVAAGGAALVLAAATLASLQPAPQSLLPPGSDVRAQILDRNGVALSATFANRWNLHDRKALHQFPVLLRDAFVAAEDQRFFEHRGIDWTARLHALTDNLRAGRAVRGASTISEQVVRMIRPRPRTIWSRWLEGFEARRLERRFSKGEILEFYLNQVPYARRQRGVVQAANDYFDRDLDTLSEREMLALAVLVRSPSRLDLARSTRSVDTRVEHLAKRLAEQGRLDRAVAARIRGAELVLERPKLEVEAPHFVRHVRQRLPNADSTRVTTFLDAELQQRAEALLEHQLAVLAPRLVGDGAVLVVDHKSDEVLAWVNAGGFSDRAGSQIDAVLTPRQPGSTLKPFLYALALERGWTAATRIDDSPLARPVGRGLHSFRNYSRRFYGPVSLRHALGNSLNIPAVRTAEAVTPAAFYRRLRALGFASLDRHPDVYGEGLALGNGEVTLFELVGAYATLARGGVSQPLAAAPFERRPVTPKRLFAPEVSSLVADILADSEARALEFGTGGVLDLPVETAVKTGTSNDYRDSWALGFSDRYTVGVWMGNLDRRSTDKVSGAVGPALVLRAVFAELRRRSGERGLPLSARLVRASVCARSGLATTGACPTLEEWFRPDRVPTKICEDHRGERSPAGDGKRTVLADQKPPRPAERTAKLRQPTPGLELARDPRIPDDLEVFPFIVEARDIERVEWLLDGKVVARTGAGEDRYLWPLVPGRHEARARVWLRSSPAMTETKNVAFLVR